MPRSTEIKIPADVLARLEALPDLHMGRRPVEPPAWKREILWRYRGKKALSDIARELGISRTTADRWMRHWPRPEGTE